MFVIRNGKILTPPLGASTARYLSRHGGPIGPEPWYPAGRDDYPEITPIRSVDRIPVGHRRRGPISERLQREFFAIVNGTAPDRYGWLTPVGTGKLAVNT